MNGTKKLYIVIRYYLLLIMVQIVDIKISQMDCPHSNISKKFDSLNILILNTSITPQRYQKIFSIFYSTNNGTIIDAFNEFVRFPTIKDVEIISKKDNIISAIYTMPQTSAFHNVSKRGFRLHPIKVSRGIENWFFVYYNDEDVIENLDFINDKNTKLLDGNKISTSQFFEKYLSLFSEMYLLKIFSNLNRIDRDIFFNAINLGFFDWPRKVNLSELSVSSKLSKSTLSYHFRKIEKLIFQNINKFSRD